MPWTKRLRSFFPTRLGDTQAALRCDSAVWFVFPSSSVYLLCDQQVRLFFLLLIRRVRVKNGWGEVPSGWEEVCAVGKWGWEKRAGT